MLRDTFSASFIPHPPMSFGDIPLNPFPGPAPLVYDEILKIFKKVSWKHVVVDCFELETPGVNLTNILHAAFSYGSFTRWFFVLYVSVPSFLRQGHWRKSYS